MKEYKYHEDNQAYFSININKEFDVSLYATLGYESAGLTMSLDDLKDMQNSIQKLIADAEKEIANKEWNERELKTYLSKDNYFRNNEDFELLCIEKGFEETEYGTYKKVY